jgi:oligoribonuclease NrnB/cAMP/cGMP phosphodiesterase (DHH superfamily)
MPTEKLLVKLFTHGDLDGFGSEVAVRLAFSEKNVNIETVVCDYPNIDKVLFDHFSSLVNTPRISNPVTIITDICPKEPKVISLINEWSSSPRLEGSLPLPINTSSEDLEKLSVLVIDHHEIALNLRKENYPWLFAEKEHCGTYLTWKVLNNLNEKKMNKLEFLQFIKLVDVYDMWRLDDIFRPVAVRLNLLFYFLGRNFLVEEYVNRYKEYTWDRLADPEGTLAYKLQEKEIEVIDNIISSNNFSADKIKVDNENKKFFIVFCDGKESEVGWRVLQEHPEIDYVVIASVRNNKLSFRSRQIENNVDVTKIAKRLGGGGHPSGNVSGVSLSDLSNNIRSDIAKRILG